ncbi:MAG: hypothetical protein B7Y84_04045 [Azorhizobium sp. 32-67-21]|nr:MAG: hypothetical protein B7Y84_04045 [Azorhizobium sp. 32-67-21]
MPERADGMTFDLVTFNIAILCLALAFGFAWFVLWRIFAHPHEIGGWVVCSVLIAIGAAFVLHSYASEAFDESFWGHVLLTAGFSMIWLQARSLAGQSLPWRGLLALNAGNLVALLVATPDPVALQVVYSITSAGPFLVSIWTLARHMSASPATRLSMFGLAVASLGEAVRLLVVLLYLTDEIPASLSNPVAIAAVLSIVFGITLCMFGFLLGVIERERSELTRIAVRDDLTGLFSRRHFQESLSRACRPAAGEARPLSLMALDLDGFKQVNDSHGHAAGDECLRRFADTARSLLKGAGEVARVGGDEFCVILPDTRLMDAMRLAEDLRRSVEAEAIDFPGGTLQMTVSIGVAEWHANPPMTPADLKAAADEALYRAKREGRNRIASARPTPVAVAG